MGSGNGQMMGNSQMSMGDVKKIEWEDDMNMMNVQSTKDTLKWKLVDQETESENMDIIWQFKKGDKVNILTYKAKSNYRRRAGFKASLLKVLIEDIVLAKPSKVSNTSKR